MKTEWRERLTEAFKATARDKGSPDFLPGGPFDHFLDELEAIFREMAKEEIVKDKMPKATRKGKPKE